MADQTPAAPTPTPAPAPVLTDAPPSAVAGPSDAPIKVLPAEASARDLGNMDLQEFADALGIQTTTVEAEAPPMLPRDTTPPVEPAAPDGDALVEGETEEPEGDVVEGEPVPPEGTAPAEPAAEAPPLATKFQIFDQQGELEIPELYLNFKGNGKEYEKVPLDKVVRLAQMGVYQHDREQQVAAQQAQAQQAVLHAQAMAQKLQQAEQFYARLMTDPSFFDQAQAIYLRQQAPEQRAARAEAGERNVREQMRAQAEEQHAATFVQQSLSPALDQLMQQNPLVSLQEVLGQFSYLTAPLLERGRVPVGRLPAVHQLVMTQLAPWVQSLQETRSLETTAQATKVAHAQQQATIAKQRLARRVAPTTGVAPGAAEDKPKDYESAQDWLADAMGQTLK